MIRAEHVARAAFRAQSASIWRCFLLARGEGARNRVLRAWLEAIRAESNRRALAERPRGIVLLPVRGDSP